MGASLRRRLRKGQPLQVRVLAMLSKASLLQPYENEPPNVRIPQLPRPWRRLRRRFAELQRARRHRRVIAKGARA